MSITLDFLFHLLKRFLISGISVQQGRGGRGPGLRWSAQGPPYFLGRSHPLGPCKEGRTRPTQHLHLLHLHLCGQKGFLGCDVT